MSQPSQVYDLLYASEMITSIREHGVIELDNSTFSKTPCPRQFLYGGILKQVPNTSRSPLVFGKAVHDMLEMYYKNGCKNDHASVDLYIEHSLKKHRQELDLCLDPKRNTQTLEALMRGYFDHYRIFGENLEPIRLKDGTLAVEVAFVVELGTINLPESSLWGFPRQVKVLWTGKIDLIARNKRNGVIGVWDHKTASMLGDTFIDQYMRSSQFSGYLFATEQLVEEKVEEVGINAICQKKVNEYKHYAFRRPPYAIEEWKRSTLKQLERTFTHLFEHSMHACTHKFGKCEFFDVCEMPPQARENALLASGMFKKSDWSPLNDA